MDQEKLTFELGKKMVVIKSLPFPNYEIDVEDLLSIHYGNIIGEVLTFPVALNRIATLKVEAENFYKMEEFDLKVFQSQKETDIRKSLIAKGVTKPTSLQIENNLYQDKEFLAKSRSVIQTHKYMRHLEELHWSMVSKDRKLDKLSDKLQSSDLDKEIMEGALNGVLIKFSKKAIQ